MGFLMPKVRDIREPVAPTEPKGWISEATRSGVREFGLCEPRGSVQWTCARDARSPIGVPWGIPFSTEIGHARNVDGARSEDLVRCTRAWKLFFLLSRMLLFRPVRRGLVPRTKLEERFRQFQSGDWTSLLLETAAVSAEAHSRSVRRRRRDTNGPRRVLDRRKARRGATAGPSGMTSDHLFPILESEADSDLLVQVGALLSIGNVPESILNAIRLGRITALCKLDAGVRGIVVGDILRRLVAKTTAKQVSKEAEAATTPFQYALSTKAGCDCVAHVFQDHGFGPRNHRHFSGWRKEIRSSPL